MKHAEGSCLVRMGDTWVLCTASVEDGVPPFLRGQGQGWVTAEYGMLPRSTTTRSRRTLGGGRQLEIQRLIGRSCVAVTDLKLVGDRTITLDCDVIRPTAARAPRPSPAPAWRSHSARGIEEPSPPPGWPIRELVAAVSVGIIGGEPRLDLAVRGGFRGRRRHERGHDRGAASSWRCRAPRRARAVRRADEPCCWRWRGRSSAADCACSATRSLRAHMPEARIVFRDAQSAQDCASLHRMPDAPGRGRSKTCAAGRPSPRSKKTAPPYAENAIKKARAVARRAAGFPAFADDTGLEVDALGGAPGVRSARYAGEKATARRIAPSCCRHWPQFPQERRRRDFAASSRSPMPDGSTHDRRRRMRGRNLAHRAGSGGFGYDPLFFAAELSADVRGSRTRRRMRSRIAGSPCGMRVELILEAL